MAEYGLLTEVSVEPRTTELAADAAVSATELEVVDAGDLDGDDGGTLILNGTQIDYTGVIWGETEDDTDLVELAAPLTVGADAGDPVQSVSGGLGEEDWYAMVDMGGGGSAVAVPIRFDQRQAWPEGFYDPPVRVVISEDLMSIEDAPGRPGSAGARVEAYNGDEWDSAGDDADSPKELTYLPRPDSLMVFQNGLRLPNAAFTLVDRVATPLAAEVSILADDKFSAYYLHDPGAATVGVGTNSDTSAYDAAVLAESTLLGYWKLSESSGLVMLDYSGNSRHGTYSADVVLGSTGLLVGDPDTSAHFPDSTAPYGVVPHASWMDVATWTIESWMATDSVSSGILALPNRDTNARSWITRVDSGGNYHSQQLHSGSADAVGTVSLDDTAEHMVVTTYDGSHLVQIVDGVQVQSVAATGDMSTGADFAIGGTYAGDSTWWAPYFFKGRQGKVAMYSGAQSLAAIQNRYEIGAGL